MGRTAASESEKLKDRIIDLEGDEFEKVRTWINNIAEVREADKKAAERREQRKAATSGGGQAE